MIKTLFFLLVAITWAEAGPKVTVLMAGKSEPAARTAAEQLKADMTGLFDAEVSILTERVGASDNLIILGAPDSHPAFSRAGISELGEQEISVKSTSEGLLVCGGSPRALIWAAAELSYRWGIRHLLQGDVLPVEKPTFTLSGIQFTQQPVIPHRTWSMYNGQLSGGESWTKDSMVKLLGQLAKLRFTHVVVPDRFGEIAEVPIDGDCGGRKAFAGAKKYGTAEHPGDLKAESERWGLTVVSFEPVTHALGASNGSFLPTFSLGSLQSQIAAEVKRGSTTICLGVQMPGDLNAAAQLASRTMLGLQLTPDSALSELVTPICGEGVAERLSKGFGYIAQAAELVGKNDPELGVPKVDMLKTRLLSKSPEPWITELKTLYANAMNEMYRANTRAREGARSFTLYHAKRLESAFHFVSAIESIKPDMMDLAAESFYNSLNSFADAARDGSDRGAIALLNLHAYKPLLKALDE
ncbi:MAG: hypothetical protein JNJ83_19605 [Verrucomicrobiaceae bacterium]|nr:hypothetical protein [Verrucomicrobiaceae bacterium]